MNPFGRQERFDDVEQYGLAAFVTLMLPCAPVAAETPATQQHLEAELASMQLEQNQFAPVYVVTSRETYGSGLRTLAASSASPRDSRWKALVISRLRAHQIGDTWSITFWGAFDQSSRLNQ